MNITLQILKEQGHNLLEEYAALDRRRRGKHAITHAYMKLDRRLNGKQPSHFGQMKTTKEVETAIEKLRSMIARREKKNRKLDRGEIYYHRGIIHKRRKPKIEFARNLSEIQKLAGKGILPVSTRKVKLLDKIKKFFRLKQ